MNVTVYQDGGGCSLYGYEAGIACLLRTHIVITELTKAQRRSGWSNGYC